MAQEHTGKMRFLSTHVGTIEDGINLINRFYWDVSIVSVGGKWYVKSGEKTMFVADTHEEADIFLYGMSLAYSIIPDKYVGEFRKDFSEDF